MILEAMKQPGIDADALTAGSEAYAAAPGFFEQYGRDILIITVAFVVMLVIILILYRRAIKQQGLLETDEVIFRSIAKEAVDFVAVISAKDRMITLRGGSWDGRATVVPDSRRVIPYGDFIAHGASMIPDGQIKERFLQLTDLEDTMRRLKETQELSASFDFRTPDGNVSRKQFKLSWLNEKAGRILLFRIDTTASLRDEIQKNNALREAAEAAEKANEAKSQFLSRISHDIRTPIGAVLNLTDFAFEDIDDREKLTDDLQKIATSGRFLLSLINDVLDISKIDSNKIELAPEAYSFKDYISEIKNIIEPMIGEKDLSYEVVTKGSTENTPTFLVDKVRLNQITLNILSNAVKYTPDGGSIIFTAGIVRPSGGEASLIFSVDDTGIGMSEEFQKIMFDEFAQETENPYRSKVPTGTGLGLPIVKRLVQLMGGEISVKSTVGKGTLIRVSLPARIIGEEEEKPAVSGKPDGTPIPVASRPGSIPSVLSGRVLLAEDNVINTQIALRIFDAMGINVDCAENGVEELTMYSGAAPGTYMAIFQDIQMPVMDGYEAVQQIRRFESENRTLFPKPVPIIAMTADALSDAIERSKEAGMDEFITKPLKADQIRNILERLKSNEKT